MEARVVVAVIAVVMLLLLLIVFWPFGAKSGSHQTTLAPTTTAGVGDASVPTTTAGPPAKIEYYAINYQWVYSGSTTQNGNDCFYASHTTVSPGQTILNASENFYWILTPYSNQCTIQINSINSSTPGFLITSTQPSLPYLLPPYSEAYIQVNMRAPTTSYFGPLTVTIHYS